MKRGGPLRRKAPMKRGEFKRKPDSGLKRTDMDRSKPPRKKVDRVPLPADPVIQPRGSMALKGQVPEGPLTPTEWWNDAYARTNYCEELHGKGISRGDSDVHHVVSKNFLRRNGHYDLVWDPRNSMVLAKSDHSHHETAAKRIPRSRVREETWAFAREIGSAAVTYIEGRYPKEGSNE